MSETSHHSHSRATPAPADSVRALSLSAFEKKLAGFTLLELMIVVAVVGILATVAYPMYTDQIRKARRSPGKAALQDVAARMEQYYLDNKTYLIAGNDLKKIGLASPYITPDGGWYGITAATTATTYLLTAAPRLGQEADTKCGSFTFNEKQEKKVTGGYILTPEKCW